YVDGPSLNHLLATGPQTMSQSVRMISQIAAALEFAHRKGVCHRDLKPNNVLLTRNNEVRLIDWGLPRVHDEAALTVRVIDYFSPQRWADHALRDPADDVFALGVLLFLSLTSHFPERRCTPDRLRAAITDAHPAVPSVIGELAAALLAPSRDN